MDVEETVLLEAAPERVWDVTVDIARWPEWNSTVERVEVLTEGPVRVGTRARLKQPGNRPAIWEVIRINEGREFVWETRTLGTLVRAHHLLEPTATGTKVTLGIEIQGATKALLGGIVRRVSRKFLPQEAASLRAECERP